MKEKDSATSSNKKREEEVHDNYHYPIASLHGSNTGPLLYMLNLSDEEASDS